MRTMTLVLALAAACAASPALAQARILTVQDQTQAPQAAQPAPPPAQTQPQAAPQQTAPVPSTPPHAAPPPAKPAQVQPPAPPKPQAAAPRETQGESQAVTKSAKDNNSEVKRQDRAPADAPRYHFTRVDDGYLRLDRKSGKVSYCSTRTQGWSCEAVPEKRASLEKQIDDLRAEVTAAKSEIAALKQEVATLRAPPPPPHPVPPQTVPPSPPPGDRTGGITLTLPNHEDLARARGFIADTWHRLVEMIEHMQNDLLRKNDAGNGVSRT
jgi:DNA polymerase III gamma/tau subunit